jgi:hypothetical protein
MSNINLFFANASVPLHGLLEGGGAIFTPAVLPNKQIAQSNQSTLKQTSADVFTSSAKIRQGNTEETAEVAMVRLRKGLYNNLITVKNALRWYGTSTEENTANQKMAEDIAQLFQLQVAEIARLKEENTRLQARANFNDPKTGGYSEIND